MLLVNKPEHKLKKEVGYHFDLLIVGILGGEGGEGERWEGGEEESMGRRRRREGGKEGREGGREWMYGRRGGRKREGKGRRGISHPLPQAHTF